MKAWELLQKSGWCQGDYAKNESDSDVSPDNPNAVCYCIMGALQRCYPTPEERELHIEKVVQFIPPSYKRYWIPDGAALVKWNDVKGRTKTEVIELLKTADV